jgi:hypothetical protein
MLHERQSHVVLSLGLRARYMPESLGAPRLPAQSQHPYRRQPLSTTDIQRSVPPAALAAPPVTVCCCVLE